MNRQNSIDLAPRWPLYVTHSDTGRIAYRLSLISTRDSCSTPATLKSGLAPQSGKGSGLSHLVFSFFSSFRHRLSSK